MPDEKTKLTLTPGLRKETSSFLKGLAQDNRSKSKRPHEYIQEARMSKPSQPVYMDDRTYQNYQKLAEKLFERYPYSKNFNKEFVERKLREAVYKATEPNGDPVQNAKEALRLIEATFEYNIESWDVYIPITGLHIEQKTSWKFGKVTFYKSSNRSFRKNELIQFKENHTINLPLQAYYACVTVKAADFDSARKIAAELIEMHCNVLNALGIVLGAVKPGNSISTYTDMGSVFNTYILAKQTRSNSSGWHWGRSIALAGISPHMLKHKYLTKHYKWRYLEKQLSDPESTLFTERILPALKWIGKSAFRTNSEDIFLDYSLAMEAIYFQTKPSGVLMDELKIRIHKLQFTNRSYLTKLVTAFKKFDDIYDVRSKIVHRGSVEVTDNYLELMYYLATGSVQKIIFYKKFRDLSSDDFEKWLMSGRKDKADAA